MTLQSRSLADQLRPLQPHFRQRHSAILPVSQVLLHLRGTDKTKLFDKARNEILDWIAGRAGRTLPDAARRGEAFELDDVGSQPVAAVTLEDPRYWAARLDDADKNVPQRTWVTEIGLADDPSDGIIFGVRLVCVTRGRDAPCDRTIPSFVRTIAVPGSAWLDAVPIRSGPWLVSDDGAVEELVQLLTRPRRADVIVIALPEVSENPADALVAAGDLYRRTLGAAHIVLLSGPASFHLSDRIGKEYSVFRQAVRTYRPGFDPDRDEPYSHPLALPHRIVEWPDGGPVSYATFLVNQSLARSVARGDAHHAVPPFATIRQIAARRRLDTARKAASSDKDLLVIAEGEIIDLKAELADQKQTYDSLIKTLEEERDDARAATEAANNRSTALRYRLEGIQQALSQRGEVLATPPIPNSLDDFETWSASYLAGSVEINGRAYQGIKKSVYQDPALVYKSLLLLRDYYVPMKREGGLDHKRAFDDYCRLLNLEESQTFSGDRWGEEGDTYVVRFAGRRRVLDRHLKKGDSRDPRRCFRLYFFWDEDSEQVVVGWLTSHLDNRLT
ncbi:MAG: hypothetical protein QY320_08290 [Gammaproteobacteria bacterium]|nr:MAG: hypothetical protein QY320_08290 [Gammaproteobacteria bacterium]